MKGKTSQYLKYAIGEVILVMIGILLVLQVNNWNEQRQLNSQFSSILMAVKADLKTDTTFTKSIIKFYDSVNKYSTKYTQNKINRKNIDSFPFCRSLLTLYQPMTIQNKGNEMLKDFNSLSRNETDSLITDISQTYAFFEGTIEMNNSLVKEEVLGNLRFFKTQSWFADWAQGRMKEDMRDYFGESLDYKNRVIANNIMATNNYQNVLKVYQQSATKLLKQIEQKLEDEN